MKVLIIEDDLNVADFIKKGLKELNHVARCAHNGKDGLYYAMTEQYDVMVVDRMLPEIDGLTLIKTLRGSGNKTPVIILSALAEVDERIKGLKSGGDDYLTKPFSFQELAARLDILYQRAIQSSDIVTRLFTKDLEVNILNRTVTRGGEKIELQAREFNLLEFLLRNKGQVVTRTMLLEHLWDYSFDPQTNVIDVHVSRLRNKIDKNFDEKIITTIRGAGYIINEDL